MDETRLDQDIFYPSGHTANWEILGDTKEKRIYHVNIGNLKDEDVDAFVLQIADSFKRTINL